MEDSQSNRMATRTRDRHGQFVRDTATVLQDAQAAALRARRMTYQQIADELGMASKSSAYEAVQRALRDALSEPAEQARQMELDDLDRAQRAVLEVLERNHVTVSHGRVVRRLVGYERDDDGEYVLDEDGKRIGVYEDVLDDGPILQAVDRLIKIGESRRKLLGLDAAQKMDVSGTVTSRIIGVPEEEL